MTTRIATITAVEIRQCKAALASKLKQLLGVSPEREEIQIEHLADPIDQMRSSTDREMALQRIGQQARLIHDIRSALTEIEEGTYGVCQQCEEPIPRKRLDAVPWARLCVPCQSEKEGRHDGKITFQNAA